MTHYNNYSNSVSRKRRTDRILEIPLAAVPSKSHVDLDLDDEL